MKTELLEKIRRLEEDRQNMDLTSGTLKPPRITVNISIVGGISRKLRRKWRYFPEWSDEMRGKRCKRKNLLDRSERKKKVALVSGTCPPREREYVDGSLFSSLLQTEPPSVLTSVSRRALHRLHAEGHRHPWRLDSYQEGENRFPVCSQSSGAAQCLISFSMSFSGKGSTFATEEESWKYVFVCRHQQIHYCRLFTSSSLNLVVSFRAVINDQWQQNQTRFTFPASCFFFFCLLWPQQPTTLLLICYLFLLFKMSS